MNVRFISISDSLPKSSSLKMVDIWLLVSLVQPFVDVLLQTYIDHLANPPHDEEKEPMVHAGKNQLGLIRKAKWTVSNRYVHIIYRKP